MNNLFSQKQQCFIFLPLALSHIGYFFPKLLSKSQVVETDLEGLPRHAFALNSTFVVRVRDFPENPLRPGEILVKGSGPCVQQLATAGIVAACALLHELAERLPRIPGVMTISTRQATIEECDTAIPHQDVPRGYNGAAGHSHKARPGTCT